MATKKATTKKTTAKKAPAKKSAAKAAPSAPAKKATEKKAVEKKASVGKKAPAKQAPAKKAPAKKAAATKAPATEATEKKKAIAIAQAPAPSEAPVNVAAEQKAPPPVRTGPPAKSGMSLEDAQKILAEVHAGRKQPKGPSRAAQPLRFTNRRRPSQVTDLNPNELRQLVAAGVDGTGEVRLPEGWLDPDETAESFYGQLEVWDVVDAHGIPVYSVWMYLVDNGTVFRASTIDVVGGVSQGGLESAEEGLEEALLDAKSRIDKQVLQDSLLRFMG